MKFRIGICEKLFAWNAYSSGRPRTREKFLAVLDKVPDVDPDDYDRP